jgi:hypothetical protein
MCVCLYAACALAALVSVSASFCYSFWLLVAFAICMLTLACPRPIQQQPNSSPMYRARLPSKATAAAAATVL